VVLARQHDPVSLTPKDVTFHSPPEFGRLTGSTGLSPKPVFRPVLYGARIGVMSAALAGDNEYPVLARIVNEADVGGQLRVEVRDLSATTKKPAHDENVNIGARFDRVLSFDMLTAFEKQPKPEVVVMLHDDLGTWRASMTTPMGRFTDEDRALEAYIGRNYYTMESEANLYYTVRRSDEEVRTLRMNVVVTGADDEVVFEQALPTILPEDQRLPIPLKALSAGRYTTKVKLFSQNGGLLDEATLDLIKRPPLKPGTEVKVDRYNRCVLVNGKPFFPFGPVSLGFPKDIPWMARVGFNVYFRWGGGYKYDELMKKGVSAKEAVARDETLKLCHENGMLVIDRFFSYAGRTAYRTFRKIRGKQRGKPNPVIGDWFRTLEDLVPHVKHHPAYFGACLFDEPNDRIFVGDKPWVQLSQEVAEAFRRLDGYHPVFNNFTISLPLEPRWRDHQDLYSYYHYWEGEGKGGDAISFYLKVCGDRAKKAHMPLFCMPQSGEHSSIPLSTQEQRANTYTFLVGGARGIYYFTWPLIHQDMYECVQQLASEVKALSAALTRRRPKQEIITTGVAAADKVVDASLLVTPDEELIFMVVNRSYRPADVTYRFDWLDRGATLERMFGPKTVLRVSERAAAEHLDMLQTRVYRVLGHRRTDPRKLYRVVIDEKHPGPVVTRNVIVNSGFEEDDGWEMDNTRARYDDSVSQSGKRSLKVMRKEGDPEIIVVSGRPVKLLRGHHYRMEGSIRLNVKELGKGKASAMLYIGMPKDSPNKYAAAGTKKSSEDWLYLKRELKIVEDAVTVPQVRVRNLVGTAWSDDFRLIDLGMPRPPVAKSKNLVPNSSFEQCKLPGWPVRWKQTPYYGFGDNLIGTKDAPWGQDDRYAVHGKYSLRTTGSQSANILLSWGQRWNAGIDLKDGKTYTFSMYLRTDKPGTPVKIDLRDFGETTVRLTRDWKRYSITKAFHETAMNNSTTAIKIYMESSDPNAHVWMDAVQLEESPTATQYVLDGYKLSPLGYGGNDEGQGGKD